MKDIAPDEPRQQRRRDHAAKNASEVVGNSGRPHFYVAKRFEQMVKVLKRRKKASFEKVKV